MIRRYALHRSRLSTRTERWIKKRSERNLRILDRDDIQSERAVETYSA